MNRKYILYVLMALSTLPIASSGYGLVTSGFFVQGDEIFAVGTIIGLVGFLILLWQFILGVRQFNKLITSDLVWINQVHQFLGIYGFLLILLHPVLLQIDSLVKFRRLISFLDLAKYNDQHVILGVLGLLILGSIWVTSALTRTKLGFRLWKKVHFLNYIILPLIFLHSFIGAFVSLESFRWYWNFLFAIYIFICIYRLLFQFGFVKFKYIIKSIDRVTNNTLKLTMSPVNKAIKPIPGQFVYFQPKVWGETHPFTLSHFDKTTNDISISAKASGKFSASLANLQIGQTIYLDGPYGIFTKEAYVTNRPIILIAGGIGITPFLQLIMKIKEDKINAPNVILFYGSQTEEDVAFRNEIEEAGKLNSKFKVVYVLSNVEKAEMPLEKGFISVDLIKKYAGGPLDNYDFFLCGPPVMIKKLMPAMLAVGVTQDHIYSEKFSL